MIVHEIRKPLNVEELTPNQIRLFLIYFITNVIY